MANKKTIKPAKSSRSKTASSDLRTNDVLADQARAANYLAAAVPFNAMKKSEYGHDNAIAPPAGAALASIPAALTAST